MESYNSYWSVYLNLELLDKKLVLFNVNPPKYWILYFISMLLNNRCYKKQRLFFSISHII